MNSKEIARLELWIVTGCIIAAFLLSIIEQVYTHQNAAVIAENFIPIFVNYMIIYICYLFLCFHVGPELNKKEGRATKNIAFVFLLITVTILVGIINVYWAILLAIKLLFILFTCNRDNKENTFYLEAGFLTCTWILTIACAFLCSFHNLAKVYLLIVMPVSVMFYLYSVYHLIPKLHPRTRKLTRYIFRMVFTTIIVCLTLWGLFALIIPSGNLQQSFLLYSSFSSISIRMLIAISGEEEAITTIALGTLLTQMFIIVPTSWNVYKNRNAIKMEEIQTLKTELGKSDANLNFLKSQINPHFLFNALNTLYGTALQENAERTSVGIQKLGDMMRFMLQENIEDKIMLAKDVDYLNNYIALQKLRVSTTSDVKIETNIEAQLNDLPIAPMLLIPFVENAFKHGISLQSPSHIKISLQTSGNTLYLDVYNSIHLKKDNDPEKLQSGIGLENVKQRLALLYPGRHELIIRDNAKEFFIHLTLKLSENE